MKIAEAFVEISARFDRLKSGLQSATAEARRGTDRIRQRFERMATVIRRSMADAVSSTVAAMRRIGLAVAGAATAFGVLLNRVAATVDAQAKLARTIGTTTQSIREMQFISSLAGVEQQTFNQAMLAFSNRLAEASSGSGEALAAFQKLGFTTADLTRLMGMDAVDAFVEVSRRYNVLATDAEKNAVAADLFSRAGIKLKLVLDQGSESIRAQQQEYRKLAGVVTEEAAGSYESFNDSVTRLKVAFGGLLAQGLAPVAEKLAEIITKVTEAIAAFGGLSQMIKMVLMEAFRQVGEIFANILDLVARSITDMALLLQAASTLAAQIPGGIGKATSKALNDQANALLGPAGDIAARASSIREQLEGSRRGESSLPPAFVAPRAEPTVRAPIQEPATPFTPGPGFLPTSSALDKPLAAVTQAITTAVASGIESVSTAIGGFNAGVEQQIQRNMLTQSQQQTRLLRDIRDGVNAAQSGGAFT